MQTPIVYKAVLSRRPQQREADSMEADSIPEHPQPAAAPDLAAEEWHRKMTAAAAASEAACIARVKQYAAAEEAKRARAQAASAEEQRRATMAAAAEAEQVAKEVAARAEAERAAFEEGTANLHSSPEFFIPDFGSNATDTEESTSDSDFSGPSEEPARKRHAPDRAGSSVSAEPRIDDDVPVAAESILPDRDPDWENTPEELAGWWPTLTTFTGIDYQGWADMLKALAEGPGSESVLQAGRGSWFRRANGLD